MPLRTTSVSSKLVPVKTPGAAPKQVSRTGQGLPSKTTTGPDSKKKPKSIGAATPSTLKPTKKKLELQTPASGSGSRTELPKKQPPPKKKPEPKVTTPRYQTKPTTSFVPVTPAATDSFQTYYLDPTPYSLLIGPPGLKGEPGPPNQFSLIGEDSLLSNCPPTWKQAVQQQLTECSTQAQLTATTPVLTREGEDKHTLSSEACAISRPLLFTLQTHHAATQELQQWRTTQLSSSLQATGVTGARDSQDRQENQDCQERGDHGAQNGQEPEKQAGKSKNKAKHKIHAAGQNKPA
ncbi:UNVERIFIED_CONTAM: hypothetical protein FKN15_037052 [Acipenser sinensis]